MQEPASNAEIDASSDRRAARSAATALDALRAGHRYRLPSGESFAAFRGVAPGTSGDWLLINATRLYAVRRDGALILCRTQGAAGTVARRGGWLTDFTALDLVPEGDGAQNGPRPNRSAGRRPESGGDGLQARDHTSDKVRGTRPRAAAAWAAGAGGVSALLWGVTAPLAGVPDALEAPVSAGVALILFALAALLYVRARRPATSPGHLGAHRQRRARHHRRERW